MFYFYITWKRQKTSGFSRVLGVYRNVALTWNGLTVCSNRIRRSSRPDVFCRKDILRNFAKFTTLFARVSFFNRVAGAACTFFKKGTLAQLFFCEFCKISKNTFFTEHRRWLLLNTTRLFMFFWFYQDSSFWFLVTRCSTGVDTEMDKKY